LLDDAAHELIWLGQAGEPLWCASSDGLRDEVVKRLP
jgi:hypothetical protein